MTVHPTEADITTIKAAWDQDIAEWKAKVASLRTALERVSRDAYAAQHFVSEGSKTRALGKIMATADAALTGEAA